MTLTRYSMESTQCINKRQRKKRCVINDIVLSEEFLSSFCDTDRGGYPPILHQVTPDLAPEASCLTAAPITTALPTRRLGQQTKALPRRQLTTNTSLCKQHKSNSNPQPQMTEATYQKQNTTPRHRNITSADLSRHHAQLMTAGSMSSEQMTAILERQEQTTAVGLARRRFGATPRDTQRKTFR